MLRKENKDDWEDEGVRMGLESRTGEDCGLEEKVLGDLGNGVLPYALKAPKSNDGCKEKPLLILVIGHEPAP